MLFPDVTMFQASEGKKSFWKALKSFDSITPIFQDIYDDPFTPIAIDSEPFNKLQRFIVLEYSITSSIITLNEARKEFFCHKNHSFENLPLTKNSFWHHLQRAIRRVGIWSLCDRSPTVPDPKDFSWKKGWPTWSQYGWQSQRLVALVDKLHSNAVSKNHARIVAVALLAWNAKTSASANVRIKLCRIRTHKHTGQWKRVN